MIGATGQKLPELRWELEVVEESADGASGFSWVIHDPLQHRYFQIDAATRRLLVHWPNCKSIEELRAVFEAESGEEIDEQQIISLIAFLRRCNLTTEHEQVHWHDLAEAASQQKRTKFLQLPRALLFFKLPLLHPQRYIMRLLHYVQPLLRRTSLVVLGLIALCGLYLISRQWDVFLASFPRFLTTEGMLILAVALFVLKGLHEMGHALMAAHFGCRISSMGMAFMFLAPMFYTDVSDAWRLSSRRKRLLISGAGMMVEVAVATLAAFLWAFLPDGIARTTAFVFATTGWTMSLLVNLNPLMRFDGYYLLADWLGIDNLQARSFAFGQWKIRQLFIAPDLSPPESFSRQTEHGLVLYAWLVWIYRLLIFSAAALVFYHFTFKLIGILLFAMVLWLLLVKPVLQEGLKWRQIMRERGSARRMMLVGAASLVLLALVVIPWSGRVSIPAMMMASDLTQLYPARAGKLVDINVGYGDRITKGAPLFALRAPDLDNEINAARIKLQSLRTRLSVAPEQRADFEERPVLLKEMETVATTLAGLQAQKERLTITAPRDAVVLQLASDLHEGRWVRKEDLLALIASNRQTIVRGYVSEADLHRLAPGQKGLFIPEDASGSVLSVELSQVNPTGSYALELKELASVYGGGIVTERNDQEQLVPRSSQFMVELSPDTETLSPQHMIRGVVNIDARRESLASRAWRQVTRVIIRELGV